MREQSRSLALAVGGNYQVTNTVTIPANAPPSYYLILKTDDQNTVLEPTRRTTEFNKLNDRRRHSRLTMNRPQVGCVQVRIIA